MASEESAAHHFKFFSLLTHADAERMQQDKCLIKRDWDKLARHTPSCLEAYQWAAKKLVKKRLADTCIPPCWFWTAMQHDEIFVVNHRPLTEGQYGTSMNGDPFRYIFWFNLDFSNALFTRFDVWEELMVLGTSRSWRSLAYWYSLSSRRKVEIHSESSLEKQVSRGIWVQGCVPYLDLSWGKIDLIA